METRIYNRHSVLNVVDLIITGNDEQVYRILAELKQSTVKQLTNSTTKPTR